MPFYELVTWHRNLTQTNGSQRGGHVDGQSNTGAHPTPTTAQRKLKKEKKNDESESAAAAAKDDPRLRIVAGMVLWGFGSREGEVLTSAVLGKVWDQSKGEFPTIEDYYAETVEAYGNNIVDYVLLLATTSWQYYLYGGMGKLGDVILYNW